MKTLTIRDFRTRPAELRRELAVESEAILTANGRPFALVTPVTSENVEEVSKAIRMARVQLAMRDVRRQARVMGTDQLSMADIDKIVADTRAAKRAAQQRTGR